MARNYAPTNHWREHAGEDSAVVWSRAYLIETTTGEFEFDSTGPAEAYVVLASGTNPEELEISASSSGAKNLAISAAGEIIIY